MRAVKPLGLVCAVIATILLVAMVTRHAPELDQWSRIGDENGYSRFMRSAGDGALVATVTVDTTVPVSVVDERFVSVGATMGSLNRTLGKTFNVTRFRTVARGLAPCIYRLGGAEADFTQFDSDDETANPNVDEYEEYGKLSFYNMTLHGKTWDDLNEFARDVGWDILFCLNALNRNGSAWDPTNAMELMSYTKRKGHRRVLWALGNEPNGYLRKAGVNITGTQMAAAFHDLRDVMGHDLGMGGAFLVGPDTSSPIKLKARGVAMPASTQKYLEAFLEGAGNVTNVTTFHFYYTNGRKASYWNFTDPVVADILAPNIVSVRKSVDKYRPLRSTIWITESGITFGSGTPGLDHNFVSGFLILDKLGISARLGVGLVVQQNLVGENGGLLDGAFSPRLPYWFLLYHKRLMGTRVLDVKKVMSGKVTHKLRRGAMNFTTYVRIYAHCTKTSWMYSPGSVTLMIINMVPIESLHVNVEGSLCESLVHQYLFTPLGAQGILSPHAMLSGQRLKMTDNFTLPYHKPRLLAAGTPLVVPPQTYGFYVFPHAAAPSCSYPQT